MLLIFLRQNPSPSPPSFKTLPKAPLVEQARLRHHAKKIIPTMEIKYYIFIIYIFFNNKT